MNERSIQVLHEPVRFMCYRQGGSPLPTVPFLAPAACSAVHMFMNPTGIFINPATRHSTTAGTSRGRRLAPPHGAGPAVGV
jgi:hypothetical protein